MTVPDYQSLMLPLLRVLSDGRELELGPVRTEMAMALGLTEDDLREKFPSGTNYVWISRFHWAKTYLDKAGAVDTVRQGVVRISQRGRDLLAENPQRIDNAMLGRFSEFRAWKEAEAKLPGRIDSATEAHTAT